MKLKFEGDISELIAGIEILKSHLGFDISPDGMPVIIQKGNGEIKITYSKNKGFIQYGGKVEFFRALGLFLENYHDGKTFEISEQPQFTMNGPMIDVSRNAVLRVETIKRLLRIMALMGLNMMMLYTEDTYTIADQPYFGYMRGRYSYEELKACDNYADALGIEMIPCIQTLGHMKQALKWQYAEDIKDTDDILLAGSEQTYQFIEKMIGAASAPFRSRRIHIGMDEAYYIGLGRYLEQNGYCRRFDIMNKHLDRVVEITRKYGLKPMIWSDMFFRLASKTGRYYNLDTQIPEDVIAKVSDKAQLVYWDYFHSGKEFYIDFIKCHKKFALPPVFAGGIWTWNGLCTNYAKILVTMYDALDACKQEGVREVIATIWGDDGNEANIFSALAGLQLFAEHGYAKELHTGKLKSRFAFCTGGDLDAFMDLRFIDDTPGTDYTQTELYKPFENAVFNPSKYILWQDLLIGLFDKHIEGLPLDEHYNTLKVKLENHMRNNDTWACVFDVYIKLCSVLSVKSVLGIEIKQLYDNNDLAGLSEIIKQKLPELAKSITALWEAHREQWLNSYKPFGWEVLDMRYGGLLSRLDTAKHRLQDYIDGVISCIEELEEERLYYDGRDSSDKAPLVNNNVYARIVTTCPM